MTGIPQTDSVEATDSGTGSGNAANMTRVAS